MRVLPGVPGMDSLRVDDRVPYPDSVTDFVKVLREHSLQPEYLDERADRRLVGHNAADQWLPILVFAREVLVDANAGLLVELIKAYLGSSEAESSVLHVDWRVAESDGSEEQFRAAGKGQEVLEALNAFERRLRDK